MTLKPRGVSHREILKMKMITVAFVFFGLVSACLTSVSLAFSNPEEQAAEYRDLITALREDSRHVIIVEQLSINTRNKARLIFPKKCEKEGELELYRLAAIAKLEETFILIPDLCLWIEVGHDETYNSVKLDSKFITAVLKQYSSLIFYHIQPGYAPDIEHYFPSYRDLLTMVLFNTESVWNPDIRIKHRLISMLGTMEYYFTNRRKVENMVKKLRAVGLRGYESQNLAYEFMRPKYRDDYYEKVKNCDLYHGTIQQKITRCSPIKTEAFTIIFRLID